MMKIFKLKQTGDTIVEVLIALAVVGFIISSAYVVVNHNTEVVLDAQERSDALGLAQTQIEALRGDPTQHTSYPFCYYNSGVGGYTATANGDFTANPPVNPSQYPGQCRFDYGGASNNSTEPVFYIFITYTPSSVSTSPGVYSVSVKWNSASSTAMNSVIVYYEI